MKGRQLAILPAHQRPQGSACLLRALTAATLEDGMSWDRDLTPEAVSSRGNLRWTLPCAGEARRLKP